MSSDIVAAVLAAVIAAVVTAFGWIVNSVLRVRETARLKRAASDQEHVRRQVEELYGPLLGLIQESRLTFEVAQARLPTNDEGNIDQQAFSAEQEHDKIWGHFVEEHFLPINERIYELLQRKRHLLVSENLPQSYLDFAKHHVTFKCLHSLWAKRRIRSDAFAGLGWPAGFEEDVKKTLGKLREQSESYRG